MNFVADRRRPVPTVYIATDRMTLPWHALQNEHSRAALIMPWLAMAAVMLFATYPELTAKASTRDFGEISIIITVVIIPLLQLLVALGLVRGTLRCLDFHGASANIGLAIVPLLPLALTAFTPLRAVEVGWEALGTIAALRLLVDRRRVVWSSGLVGGVLGLLASVSFAGIWLAVAAAAFFAVQFLREGRGQPLAAFTAGVALTQVVLHVIGLALPEYGEAGFAFANIAHLVSMAAAAASVWGLACRPRPPALLGRLIALAATAGVALIGPLFAHGVVALMPFFEAGERVAIVVRAGQWHDATGMTVASAILWFLAVFLRRRGLENSINSRGWQAVCLTSGPMLVLGFFDWRAALFAQILAIPMFALLLCDALRIASRFSNGALRTVAVCLALFLLTPTGGSVTGGVAHNIAEGRTPVLPQPLQMAATSISSAGIFP